MGDCLSGTVANDEADPPGPPARPPGVEGEEEALVEFENEGGRESIGAAPAGSGRE